MNTGILSSRKRKVAVGVILIVVVAFSMQFLAPLQTPITTPVIVALSNDEPVAYTASEVKELLDGKATVITAQDTLGQLFILPRAVGEVVFVGHGSPQEVKVGEAMVSWNTFVENDLMKLKSQSIYVATCYSENAADVVSNKYGNSKTVIGFKGLVDADEAAYLVSSVMMFTRGESEKGMGLLNQLTNVMIGKIQTPEKYNHWLLYSQWVRGIYHIKYDTPFHGTKISYTHPDWDYYGVNIESMCAINANQNLEVGHIPKSIIDTYNIASVFASGIAGLGAGAYLSKFVGGVVGFLLLIAGVVQALFIDNFVRDEFGSSWLSIQNYVQYWSGLFLYEVCDLKIGQFMWIRFVAQLLFGVFPSGIAGYPLFYGGKDLGIDGM